MFKESLIFILGYFTLIAIPNGLQVVQNLSIKLNGIVDEEGIFSEDLFNFALSRELSRLRLELHDNLGTSLEIKIVNCGDLVLSAAVRDPSHTLSFSG